MVNREPGDIIFVMSKSFTISTEVGGGVTVLSTEPNKIDVSAFRYFDEAGAIASFAGGKNLTVTGSGARTVYFGLTDGSIVQSLNNIKETGAGVFALTLNDDNIVTAFLKASSGGGNANASADYTVADITERDALENLEENDTVFVTDATADNTVTTGWAVYRYDGENFVKLSEEESLDFVPDGTDLTYDPATRTISSSTGGDVVLPEAGVNPGLLSVADKSKLDNVPADTTTELGEKADTDSVNSALATKAPLSHGHTKSQITDFDDADYATNAQGAKADTATQPGDLHTVATTGDYGDLANTPDLSAFDNVDTYANLASFPGTGADDVFYIASDTGILYRWNGSAYVEVSGGIALGETSETAYRGDRGKVAFDHTSDTANPHGVTKAQVGLGNADNTSDANKPISTATQTALDGKADDGHGHAIADVTGLQTALDGKSATGHTHTASEITDFDTEVANNAAVTANTAKVSNATHTGDVAGATALTIQATAISGKTLATLAGTEEVLVNDGGTLKKTTVQAIADLGGGGAEYKTIDLPGYLTTGILSYMDNLDIRIYSNYPNLEILDLATKEVTTLPNATAQYGATPSTTPFAYVVDGANEYIYCQVRELNGSWANEIGRYDITDRNNVTFAYVNGSPTGSNIPTWHKYRNGKILLSNNSYASSTRTLVDTWDINHSTNTMSNQTQLNLSGGYTSGDIAWTDDKIFFSSANYKWFDRRLDIATNTVDESFFVQANSYSGSKNFITSDGTIYLSDPGTGMHGATTLIEFKPY